MVPLSLVPPSAIASYELVNVHGLPMIDASRSIKSVLCTTRSVHRFNAFLRASIRVITTLHIVSLPFDIAIFFVPGAVGHWCALVKVALQTPLIVVAFAALRTDMLVCLLQTYEFWFLSAINLATCAVYCAYFRDLRAAGMVIHGIGVFMNICVDANLLSRQLAITSFLYIPYQLVVLLAVALQLTPDTHHMTLFQYKGRAVSSDDFLINSLTIILILMVRTAYRKRQFLKQRYTSSQISCCVMYRCRVKLQLRDPSAAVASPRTMHDSMTDELRATMMTVGARPLRYSSNHAVFVESDVMSSWMFERLHDPSERVRKWRAIALYATGICGLMFNIFPFLSRKYSFHGNRFTAFSALALTCTLSFIAVFASCYNRKLLRELVFSFDFAALSLQLSVVHLCACDVFYWDGRCYFVLFNWLAMHWVLTLDALTPAMRRSLGLNVRFVIPIVVFFVLAILRISLDMVVLEPTRPFQDRLLWSFELLGHRIEFYTGPFILNRAWTLLLWCFRVLWRLCTSGEDDRIIIQGNVELIRQQRMASTEHFGRTVSVVQTKGLAAIASARALKPTKTPVVVLSRTTRVFPLSLWAEATK